MVLLCPEFFAVYTIESFALKGEKNSILKDIYYRNQAGRQKETVAKATREL